MENAPVRAVKDIAQVQIVLNELLDYKKSDSTRARNQNGNQIKNTGAGIDPSDVVIMSQISSLAPSSSVPSVAAVDHFYTIPWSFDGNPIPGMIIPPFCIVNDDRVGQPTALWLAAATPGAGNLSINIRINGNNGKTPVTIFLADLTLPAGQNGPVQQSNFITPLPFFGIGTYIQPIITFASTQSAISFGITVKKVRQVGLS